MADQQQDVVVNVPMVGDVSFPSSMSMTEITQAVKKLHNNAVLMDPNRKVPSAEDYLPKAAPSGGFMDTMKGVLENLIPSADMVKVQFGDPLAANRLGQGLIDSHTQQFQKAKASADAAKTEPNMLRTVADLVEAGGHGAAGLIPFIGPAAGQSGERIADPKQRARGIGNAIGLLAPAAIHGVASEAAPRAANALDAAATDTMVDVTAPKTGLNKTRFGNMAEKVAPRLAREDGMNAASRGGLADKVSAKLAEARDALDTTADERNGLKTFDTAPVVEQLDTIRNSLKSDSVKGSGISYQKITVDGKPATTWIKDQGPLGRDVVPAENQPAYSTITRMMNEVKALGPVAPYESLRRLRAAWDEGAKLQYTPSIAADYLKKQGVGRASSNAAGAMRDYLAGQEPATAKANAEFTFWKRADDVLSAAEEADRVRPTRLRRTIADSASGMSRSILPSLIERIASSGYTTKIAAARLMANLADAIRSGRSDAAASILTQVEALAPAGAMAPGLSAPSAVPALAQNEKR